MAYILQFSCIMYEGNTRINVTRISGEQCFSRMVYVCFFTYQHNRLGRSRSPTMLVYTCTCRYGTCTCTCMCAHVACVCVCVCVCLGVCHTCMYMYIVNLAGEGMAHVGRETGSSLCVEDTHSKCVPNFPFLPRTLDPNTSLLPYYNT